MRESAGIASYEGHIRETIGLKSRQDAVFDLVPYVREERSIFRIVGTQAVYLLAEPGVVVRIGMDEAVKRVHSPMIESRCRFILN